LRKTSQFIRLYNIHIISDQQEYIFKKIQKNKKIDFKKLFADCVDKIHAIVNFLALLELLNLQKLSLIQGEGINNFWVTSYIIEDIPEIEVAPEMIDTNINDEV
jgi:chromatin segregation and condensation protein Rec8/ScpA/Scc1 (kleisin family)